MSTINFNQLCYLPSCNVTHASTQQAIKFKLCGESLLYTPKSAILDGVVSYGGSTGVGLNLVRKAYGEFLERNHLFTKVPVFNKKKLSEISPQRYQEKLLGLCSLDKQSREDCLAHEFLFTKVVNLFSEIEQDYFYNTVSLSISKDDQPFLGFTDSCACAAHPVKEAALENSVLEFIERQALLGSWMSKTYQYSINPELLRYITPYDELVDLLLDNGELYIVQNGLDLPGHTVIIFYFSKSEKDVVQYAIGSSSGLTIEDALSSALVELYQCYTFLYNAEYSTGLENKAGAGYHLSFRKCNHSGIRDTIPFLNHFKPFEINTLAELSALESFTYEQLLAALKTQSSDIYYYHHYDPSLELHITKVLSPDFFAHMSLNQYLNFESYFAKKLGITKDNAFLGKIPFP